MPNISVKGQELPASPIRKLVPYAEAAKARGVKVHHLNIGQPDIPTPEGVRKAIRQIDDRVVEYTHSAGMESYRRKLAEYYRSIGIEIDYQEILITVGGSEALVTAMTVCLDAGDELLVPEPFYANYSGFAVESGVIIRPITSTIENHFALPPIEEFERHIGSKTKGILICNPNNPTGYLYREQELEQLKEIVQKYDLFLFSDEVYREFCYDGAVHHSALELKGIEQNVIVIDSVSKRYSLCGARVGALISHNKAVIDAGLRVGQARLCPPYYSQVAAEAAIDTPIEYFKEVHREYTERRNYLIHALNDIPGVFCPMPKGAFYAMVKLPIDDCDRFAQWMLEEFSYRGQTVMIAPGIGFYETKCLGQDEARIAYVLNLEDLKHSVECLRQALKVYPGRTV